MQALTRETLKKLFKKVKKLHLPDELEKVDFSKLKYYSWPDESSQRIYIVTDYKAATSGIKLEFIKSGSGPLRLGFCEFCHKHRKSHEVLFVATQTRRKPKNINYRSRGTWICADYRQCNKDLKNPDRVTEFFYRILDEV